MLPLLDPTRIKSLKFEECSHGTIPATHHCGGRGSIGDNRWAQIKGREVQSELKTE
jgi:hypothetical protein